MSRAETKHRAIGNLQTGAALARKPGAICLRECVRGAIVTISLFSLLAAAPAVAHEQSTLPSLDLIDAQTDIKVFLQDWVPEELRVAALRRAWTGDPAIRDFIGLQEVDWDFSDPDSILGFGELGPEVDIEKMVARIFGESPQLVAGLPERRPNLFSRLALRLFDPRSTAAAAP